MYLVWICDGTPRRAESEVLSGYVSSYPPHIESNIRSCSVQIRNLPQNSHVKFDAVDQTGTAFTTDAFAITLGGMQPPLQKGDVVVRTSNENGVIELDGQVSDTSGGSETMRFNYRYNGNQFYTSHVYFQLLFNPYADTN